MIREVIGDKAKYAERSIGVLSDTRDSRCIVRRGCQRDGTGEMKKRNSVFLNIN